jgi:tetratricopeptide (TPR) repeat protein
MGGAQHHRQPTDILAVEEETAPENSENLRLQLNGEDGKQLTIQVPQNPEAYRAYLQGRYYWNKRDRKGFEKALDFFGEAIDRDPTYGQAYSGLADTYSMMGSWAYLIREESLPLARALAQKALEIDDTLTEAHTSMGQVKILE